MALHVFSDGMQFRSNALLKHAICDIPQKFPASYIRGPYRSSAKRHPAIIEIGGRKTWY